MKVDNQVCALIPNLSCDLIVEIFFLKLILMIRSKIINQLILVVFLIMESSTLIYSLKLKFRKNVIPFISTNKFCSENSSDQNSQEVCSQTSIQTEL